MTCDGRSVDQWDCHGIFRQTIILSLVLLSNISVNILLSPSMVGCSSKAKPAVVQSPPLARTTVVASMFTQFVPKAAVGARENAAPRAVSRSVIAVPSPLWNW